jgi:hypothetical protein
MAKALGKPSFTIFLHGLKRKIHEDGIHVSTFKIINRIAIAKKKKELKQDTLSYIKNLNPTYLKIN